MPPLLDKPLRVLANFHHSQSLGWWDSPASGGTPDRRDAFTALENTTSLLNDVALVFDQKRSPRDTWHEHRHFSFEISPQGNGLDCHRTWEALLLGTIPIVKSSSMDTLLRTFPVLILSDWNELKHTDLAHWKRTFAPWFNASMTDRLTVEYWSDRVRGMQAKLKQQRAS